MEIKPEDEALDHLFSCASPESHDQVMFSLRWMINQRTKRIEFDHPPILSIGFTLL